MSLLRPSYRRDAVGSRRQDFLPRGYINGYVASRSMTEGFVGDRQRAAEVVTIYVQGASDVVVTDRLKIGSTTYEVTGVRTPGHRAAGDRLFYKIIDATSNEGV
jgi:head-tail adaptor